MISYSAKSFSLLNSLTLFLIFLVSMKIETLKQFADMTRFDVDLINDLWKNPYVVTAKSTPLKKTGQSSILDINTYSVTKRNNKHETRDIYYPESLKLKTILKITSKWLSNVYSPPYVVNGFIKKKGIFSNAEPHLSCKLLIKLDLENFYEQISRNRIVSSLEQHGLETNKAKLIAKICTVDGKLVQGFSTSPVISNIVTHSLDIQLAKYCKDSNITYTRYADDMSFSSMQESIDINDIKKMIESFGYTINHAKTKVLKRGFYQSVTGLTIFDPIQPRIPKRIKRKLRLEAYYINKFGIKNHAIRRMVKKGTYNNNADLETELSKEIKLTRERIGGWIHYSKGIEPDFSQSIKDLFENRNR